jgi:hypothetical protein
VGGYPYAAPEPKRKKSIEAGTVSQETLLRQKNKELSKTLERVELSLISGR